ncbi:MAG: Cna B-type domain-containing protein, partial [Clostridia bacterium]|nr:Cna B-type domain-containing protein [Clostridia bacterium]
STAIQNVATGRYLHPFYNSGSDNGITAPGRWGTTVSASGTGAKFSHSAYIGFDSSSETFYMTREQNQNVTFKIGQLTPVTVWLDGTNGGIMSLGGSDDRSYTAYTNSTMTLPTSWKSPDKYSYVLKGWYDVVNNKYYAPGDKVVITGNTVFYADWMAASYDVGEFNSQVAETVSTNSFVTTRLFDYGALMNVLSEKANVTVNNSSHSETWNLLTNGNNSYNGNPTFNFILRDWDRGDEDISYPKNHNAINNPTDAGTVYPGLYTDAIRDTFFDPELEIPGKTYVGEADHLFQLCLDPNHEHYGYYYYNSEHNAASYSQSDGRFYVYDYLEATRDSINNGDEGKYSDFLPFNSPYENTNGKSPVTYSYEGTEGEYVGTTHYMYDSRYNDNDNSVNNVGTNFWFGMSVEIDFYLPLAPGGKTQSGEYGNKDIYGADMHFRFTGDDDVWVFVDDTLVLDLGGLHGRETGDINFSTGVVTINGVRNDALTRALQSVSAGEHKLTLYYMERGSSMSNCAIYFNLAPRFSFSIEKEDVLTKHVLNGAQFSVYTDKACTVPAELWVSKESHDRGDPSTNVFTVTNGVANMWGMGAGNVYYIKETRPPDDPNYGLPNGIICASLDKVGTASYNVEILDEGSGVSGGFIVHGFRIDAETQNAYIIATNAPKWVKEITSVEAIKYWDDALDHTGEEVTLYLTVTDADGTVRRLQEAKVSADTDWRAKWENLPKYSEDGKTLIQYGVEESYVSGYYSGVESAEGQFVINKVQWSKAENFEDGKVYILLNSNGQALSTQVYAEDTGYMWVDQEAAKTSDLAQWKASISGKKVRLTNLAGQTITFYYGNGSPTDFFALNQHIEDNNRKQYFTMENRNGGIVLKYDRYYLYSALNSSQKFQNGTQANSALVLSLLSEQKVNTTINIEGQGYIVTNTPLEKETSVTVYKSWSIPPDMDESVFEQQQVTVRLFANGTDTGRTITLNLKNGWQGVFRGLPYQDADGNVIIYSVKEVQVRDQWVVSYSDLSVSGGSTPNYTVTVTNTYRTGGPVLPSTGSSARMTYMICGAAIMLVPLIYIIFFRRIRERGSG